MKYKICLFLFLMASHCVSAQIGINTEKPLGIFHVDGNGDNNSGTLTNKETNNDFIITSEGNVGIGTTNPTGKLSVNGNFSAPNLKNITPNSDNKDTGYENLYISGNGELLLVRSNSSEEPTVPINFLSYTLTNLSNVELVSYDTKISSSEFLLTIIGYELSKGGSEIGLNVTDPNLVKRGSTFTGVKIKAIDNGKTWELSLNYPGASVASGAGNVQWLINCLAISKTTVKILDDQVYDLGGKNTSAATTYPEGL